MKTCLQTLRLLALLLPLLPACVGADEILVFGAASLTDVLAELGQAHQREGGSGGDEVAFSFAGSNDLARQIRAGAPADVFVSADLNQMDRLEEAGLVSSADRQVLLSNALVIVVPSAAATTRLQPEGLLEMRRIALANPEAVPAGLYARAFLEGHGLWERLQSRVIPTLDVRAALAAVENEHVDAAIVYRTDAAISRRVKVVHEVALEQGPHIVYPVAVLSTSRNQAAARRFVRFLLSAQARDVFEQHGFIVTSRDSSPW